MVSDYIAIMKIPSKNHTKYRVKHLEEAITNIYIPVDILKCIIQFEGSISYMIRKTMLTDLYLNVNSPCFIYNTLQEIHIDNNYDINKKYIYNMTADINNLPIKLNILNYHIKKKNIILIE